MWSGDEVDLDDETHDLHTLLFEKSANPFSSLQGTKRPAPIARHEGLEQVEDDGGSKKDETVAGDQGDGAGEGDMRWEDEGGGGGEAKRRRMTPTKKQNLTPCTKVSIRPTTSVSVWILNRA